MAAKNSGPPSDFRCSLPAAVDQLRQTRDRRLAGAVQLGQQRTLGRDAQPGIPAGYSLQPVARSCVVLADLETDGALGHRRQHDFGFQDVGDPLGLAEALQPGDSKQRGIDFAFGKLAQAGRHIAAEIDH